METKRKACRSGRHGTWLSSSGFALALGGYRARKHALRAEARKHALRAVAATLKRFISFTLKLCGGPSLRAGTFRFLPSPQALKPSSPQALKPSSPHALKPSSPQALKPSSPQALKPSSPQALKPSSPLALLLALLLGKRSTKGAGFSFLVQERGIGCTGSGEFTVLFAPDFDGHTKESEAQKARCDED